MNEFTQDRETMEAFWKNQAQSNAATIQTMMLDSNAEILSKDELPEILSYLPDMTNKRVVELGAGIGRFTTIVADKACHVVAVDFMEEFIEKNKAQNSHHTNITYMCEDVTKLELPAERSDLVFSNWLFMYLEDKQVEAVFNSSLKWLQEGGYLFIRESCNRPSGNRPRSSNPTRYRDIKQYEAFYLAANIPCDDQCNFGFDLVLSTPVATYIKHKNNKDQMVFLLQKVRREKITNHGFKTFQEFLNNQQYTGSKIRRFERVFGDSFISPGGLSSTKEFVKMLDLHAGQKVLDIGCGIGGSAFYMARALKVKVTGIDLSSNMIIIALERAEELGISPDEVVFEIADATKREFAESSFDVIYSRDTILHIKDKVALFKRFYKWLKPGGKVLISDYCCKHGEHSDEFKSYVKQRGYNLLSPNQYGQCLEEVGLVNVKAEDRTCMFADILHHELERIESTRSEFIKDFSEEDYNDIIRGWSEKLQRVGSGEGDQRWGLFYAEKPNH